MTTPPNKGRGIYASTDNGVTWTKKVNGLGADTNVVSIHNLPNGNLLADVDKGAGHQLYMSTDDGNNWSFIQNTGVNAVVFIKQIQNGDVLMSTGSALYKTINNGLSFTALAPSLPQGNIYEIYSSVDSLYARSNDYIIKSQDGINWTSITPTGLPAQTFLSLIKTGGDTLFAGFTGSGIYYSPDWGKTWTSSTGSGGQVGDLFLSNTGRMFAGRSNSGIYRSGVVLNITAIAKAQNAEEFQIALSPNPVNDLAKFSYNLKESGLVSIKLIDGNGKIIKQLFNGSQSMGEHDLSINATDLTNSAYYILIETDGKQGLKKMIIVK